MVSNEGKIVTGNNKNMMACEYPWQYVPSLPIEKSSSVTDRSHVIVSYALHQLPTRKAPNIVKAT